MVLNLPSLADVEAARRGQSFPKGATRTETRTVDDRQAKKDEALFRRDVFKRDQGHCRCCGRAVVKTLEHVAQRAEAHHLHGRLGKLRYLVKTAILLCLHDHERVTGTVNDKLKVVGTKCFRFEGRTLIDGSKPVTFEKVA